MISYTSGRELDNLTKLMKFSTSTLVETFKSHVYIGDLTVTEPSLVNTKILREVSEFTEVFRCEGQHSYTIGKGMYR